MIRRLLPSPVWTVLLAGLWLLLARWITPGTVVMALAAGIGIPLLLRDSLPEGRPRRPLLLLPYALLVLWDIIRSSLTVARLVLFQKAEAFAPAWIVVPTALEAPGAVAILAGTITLTPGTLSADVATDGRTILVHCLHAPDPEAVADTIRARYEARLKRIYG